MPSSFRPHTYVVDDPQFLHKKSVSLPTANEYCVPAIARFIYVTGCDGTGKSTQVEKIMQRLADAGKEPIHLWLRFPFLLSLPLLAYARLAGFSVNEQIGDTTYGTWHFNRSWLLRTFLPWVLLIDTALFALWKVHLPLLLWRITDHADRVIVCERFALDTLVDLAVGLNVADTKNGQFFERLPGRLFRYLLPKNASITFLDLDATTARARRPDLIHDQRLETRLQAFRNLAAVLKNSSLDFKMLSSLLPIDELNREIIEL